MNHEKNVLFIIALMCKYTIDFFFRGTQTQIVQISVDFYHLNVQEPKLNVKTMNFA